MGGSEPRARPGLWGKAFCSPSSVVLGEGLRQPEITGKVPQGPAATRGLGAAGGPYGGSRMETS